MIKYFCDICEGEVDKENPLNEMTISVSPLNSDKGRILTVKQICQSCMKVLESDIARKLQRIIRGY